MSVNDKISLILEKLLIQTQNGSAKWAVEELPPWEKSSAQGILTFDSINSSVELSNLYNGEEYPFRVKIFNASGVQIWSESIDRISPLASTVSELYRLAQLQALKVDETLDDLIDSLEDNELL